MKFPVSWKTTLFGILAFVTVNAEALGVPTKYQKIIEGISIAAIGFSAKDKNVSNAPNPMPAAEKVQP